MPAGGSQGVLAPRPLGTYAGRWYQRAVTGDDDLRASRARLVAAAIAERRGLERALHDGVQQDLVAISMRLQLLRETLEGDAPRALQLVEELRNDVHDALERVRAVAGAVYPSVLGPWGLTDSLREAARAAGTRVRVVSAGVARYPVETEGAVYFCCSAALDQAAPGTELQLTGDDSALRVQFVPGNGADLTVVRDLVGAAGGTLDERRDDGTVAATFALG